MSKVDIIVICLLAIIMSLFFWLGTKWAFFGAGVCAAVIFFICIGFWLRNLEFGHRSKEWENFLKTLDNGEKMQEGNIPDAK